MDRSPNRDIPSISTLNEIEGDCDCENFGAALALEFCVPKTFAVMSENAGSIVRGMM